jgi:hypothetical protein
VNPLLRAAAIGAGVVGVFGVLLLFEKKAKAAPLLPQQPSPTTYGETTRVSLPVPDGWRRATNTDLQSASDLASHAVALRNTPGFTSMPYGTLSPFVASDGKTYATWVEQHYHEPGGPMKPWGLHHGVTLLAKV